MISRNTDKAKAQAKLRAQPVRWERMSQHTASDSRAGTHVLHTRHSDSEVLRLAESYWRPIEVDATFRGLKGETGLPPSWHMKQDRIRAHLFIAVLAYHSVHLLRTLLQRQGIHIIWAWIRKQVGGPDPGDHGDQDERGGADQDPPGHARLSRGAEFARAVGVEPRLYRQRRRTRLSEPPAN